jgi:hypothetical protein
MRRTLLQALLTLTGIAALAIATSCYSDLTNDFQDLEPDSTAIDIFKVTDGANTQGTIAIYNNQWVAQQFVYTASSYLCSGFRIKLKRHGDFSGYTTAPKLKGWLYSDTGDKPDAVISAYTYSYTKSVLLISEDEPASSDDYVAFQFNIRPTLTANTKYWVVLKMDTANGDIANNIYYYHNNNGSNKACHTINGGTNWIYEGGDLGIIIPGYSQP